VDVSNRHVVSLILAMVGIMVIEKLSKKGNNYGKDDAGNAGDVQ
jgi:hypothetical protein